MISLVVGDDTEIAADDLEVLRRPFERHIPQAGRRRSALRNVSCTPRTGLLFVAT
jgi:hypothetical protein